MVLENQDNIIGQNEQESIESAQGLQQATSSVYVAKSKRKIKPFKFTIVGVQLAIIGVLVATIFLTNALYKDSGINVFLRGVFGGDKTMVDTRVYSEFSPVISMGDNNGVVVSNGIINFAGEGSVYAPCGGVVKKIAVTGSGKFDIEIEHSQNFKSIISNVEHVYVSQGDIVYCNIPVGYLESDGASICFTDSQGDLLDDYDMVGNMVVWQA